MLSGRRGGIGSGTKTTVLRISAGTVTLMGRVDNLVVRDAVSAFAAEPSQAHALHVLRACMYGELLFDITGSNAFTDPAHPFQPGAELRIAAGSGPDGGRALLTFTCQEEIDRRHPPGTATQSLVTPAVDALTLARNEGDPWLYIDPAGPTCALSATEIDFALRNPNNALLKATLAEYSTGATTRSAVVDVLRSDGPLLLAVDESTPGNRTMRMMQDRGGSVWLAGFTSGAEVIVMNPTDAVAKLSTAEVLDTVRDRGVRGLLLNPAGPWIALPVEELLDRSVPPAHPSAGEPPTGPPMAGRV